MAYWRWTGITIPRAEEQYRKHVEDWELLEGYLHAMECLLQQCDLQADRLWLVRELLVRVSEMDCMLEAMLKPNRVQDWPTLG